MDLFETLEAFCTRRSNQVNDVDKRKWSYMIRRFMSAQFPIHCESVNRMDTDELVTTNLMSLLCMRYNGIPSFVRMKISQKKKKFSIRSEYDDCVIDKYMEINECGIREVEEAYAFNPEEVDKALNLIKANFFDNKNKVVVKKTKSVSKKKQKEEETLF